MNGKENPPLQLHLEEKRRIVGGVGMKGTKPHLLQPTRKKNCVVGGWWQQVELSWKKNNDNGMFFCGTTKGLV